MSNKTNEVSFKITNCTSCKFHEVRPDPDPYDWFCDDDVRVVCTKASRNITVACRPHHIKNETSIPNWCPLLSNPKQ